MKPTSLRPLAGRNHHIDRSPVARAAAGSRALWIAALIVVAVRVFVPNALLAEYMNYSQEGGAWWEKFHPGTLALFAVALCSLPRAWRRLRREDVNVLQATLPLALVCILVGMLKTAYGSGDVNGLTAIVDTVASAIAASIMFVALEAHQRKHLGYVLLALLVMNDIVLFAEYATSTRLMPYQFQELVFRPTAFLNHPLQNGLLNACAVPLALLLPARISLRFGISLLLVASCFVAGARAASVGAAITIVLAGLELARRSNGKRRNAARHATVILATALLLVVVCGSLILLGVNARLLTVGMDDGTLSRLAAFGAFGLLTPRELMIGVDRATEWLLRTESLKVFAIENWFVVYVVHFGLPAAILLGGSIAHFLWRLGRRGDTLVLLAGLMFFVISSTNNGFSSKGPSLVFIATLMIAFACGQSTRSATRDLKPTRKMRVLAGAPMPARRGESPRQTPVNQSA